MSEIVTKATFEQKRTNQPFSFFERKNGRANTSRRSWRIRVGAPASAEPRRYILRSFGCVAPWNVKRLVASRLDSKTELLGGKEKQSRRARQTPEHLRALRGVLGRSQKEMDDENTRLAAGNNFLIAGDASDPALVTDRGPEGYLATNWQRLDIKVQITCKDRRFPTPHPQRRNNRANGCKLTTRHLLEPNDPRMAAWLLPIWLPNPNCSCIVPSPRSVLWRAAAGIKK
jgi:hypothetical protein